MSLRQWLSNSWLKVEPTSRQEIANLFAIVDRDMKDATGSVSSDWRFGIAYNAALKLCTILLRAEGYRAVHGLQHYRTIMAMPLVLGETKIDDADYLNACRAKRNKIEYDYVGGATDKDADELPEYTEELRQEVVSWLNSHHPELL
jgi:hypothetical protein